MKTEFKNLKKMRGFISSQIKPISDFDFNDWITYLKEFAEHVEEIENEEFNHKELIKSGNLTLTLEDEDYEVKVIFIRTIVKGEIVYLIDLDYTEDIEEI